jgi:hypothetical protein
VPHRRPAAGIDRRRRPNGLMWTYLPWVKKAGDSRMDLCQRLDELAAILKMMEGEPIHVDLHR